MTDAKSNFIEQTLACFLGSSKSMLMPCPISTCYHVLQPCSPLFTNIATKINNDTISIRPGKSKTTLSFTAIKNITTRSDLNFEDTSTRFRIKGLVNRITTLSSSNTKPQMLQILEKDPELFQTISDINHLLMALVIAREPNICLSIFTKLPSFHLVPDSCTHSIMIRCHCEQNHMDGAMRALDTALDKGFLPDAATFTVLINSLCKRGRVNKAREVFEVMGGKGYKASVHAQNCLLKGLSYVGKVDEALEMLMGMKGTSSLEPDVYSFTAVMDGLCKVGRSDEAMELLNEAVGMGVVPNVVTFNTLLQGYSREGRPMEGVVVLEMMKKEHGCVPDCVSYSTVLHGLLKWNEVVAALGVYKEMVGLGLEVDLRMMGTLVRRLCKMSRKKDRDRGLLQDAGEVFEEMKERGLVVDQETLEVMVQALCEGKRFDQALENLNEMVRLGYSPEVITFDKVIQGLCDGGRVDDAVSTLVLLHANGGIPNRITYDVLINGLNEEGRLFCASNLFGAAVKQGLVLVLNREPKLNAIKREELQADMEI